MNDSVFVVRTAITEGDVVGAIERQPRETDERGHVVCDAFSLGPDGVLPLCSQSVVLLGVASRDYMAAEVFSIDA